MNRYVSTTGRNTNDGSVTSPWHTLTYGVSRIGAGDSLIVRGGDYPEWFDNNVPSGESWDRPVTIESYPGEDVWLRPQSGHSCVLFSSGNIRYVVFNRISMDGSRLDHGVITIEQYEGTSFTPCDSHHIRVQDGTIKGNPIPDRQTILCSGVKATPTGGNEFLDLIVEAGGGTDFDHAFYLSSSDNLVAGCSISNFSGAALHIYNSPGNQFYRTKLRRNLIKDGRAHDGRHYGILISSGAHDSEVVNNVVTGVPYHQYCGAINTYQCGRGNVFYHNTVTRNAAIGFRLDRESAPVTVRNNVSYQNGGGNFVSEGTIIVADHNATSDTDPQFVDPDHGDFSLKATSPLRDAGVILSSVTVDRIGTTRPQGPTSDIGAYEYTTALKPPLPPDPAVPSHLAWDQVGQPLAVAQSATYHGYLDDQMIGIALSAVCVQVGSLVQCTAPLPLTAPGPHTISVTQTISGSESSPSNVASFTTPPKVESVSPTNLRTT